MVTPVESNSKPKVLPVEKPVNKEKKPELSKIEQKELIIDGAETTLGRLASYAAKQALFGKKVIILNCNKIIVTGKPASVKKHYAERKKRGGANFKGPYFPQQPFRIVKRTIRGMLPYRRGRGQDAVKNILCYDNVPEKYQESKKEKVLQRPLRTTTISLEKIKEAI